MSKITRTPIPEKLQEHLYEKNYKNAIQHRYKKTYMSKTKNK